MRASDFLSAPVLSPEGARMGVVIDIRTRPEPTGEGEVGLIVDGFIVGKRGWRLFGYERKREHGPLLLKWLVGLIHRNTRYARGTTSSHSRASRSVSPVRGRACRSFGTSTSADRCADHPDPGAGDRGLQTRAVVPTGTVDFVMSTQDSSSSPASRGRKRFPPIRW